MSEINSVRDSLLFQKLQKVNSSLAESVAKCWGVAEKELRQVPATHPFFTSHGIDHSAALLRILDRMCSDCKLEMNEHELYILLCATGLHDIGMVGQAGADPSEGSRIRDTHHIRSLHRILENGPHYGLEKTYLQMIADVAAAHRKIVIDDVRERAVEIISGNPPRARLCATLLRIADECHITYDRVPDDYSLLGLPSTSAQHFQLHSDATGLRFDASKGLIDFAITVKTEKQSEFVKATREKIQSEIATLEPQRVRYGIPYHTVTTTEIRDEVIRTKILRTLLKHPRLPEHELIANVVREGEEECEIQRYLRIYGSESPIVVDETEEERVYSLKMSIGTLAILTRQFIQKQERPTDPLILIKSPVARQVVRSPEFLVLIRKCIGPTDSFKTALLIVQTSPQALHFIVTSELDASGLAFVAGGHYLTMLGQLLRDIEIHPEILLKPDLIDVLREEGGIDQKKYDQLRGLQGAVYLQAFDRQRVIEQWALHDRDQEDELVPPGMRVHRGTFTFTYPRETILPDPGLLMAAAFRLRLPIAMQETDSFKIDMKMEEENQEETRKSAEGYAQLFISPEKTLPLVGLERCCPATIAIDTNGDFVICIHSDHAGSIEEWKKPFFVDFKIQEPESQDTVAERQLTVNFAISTNYDCLDCTTAEILAQAEETTTKTVRIQLGARPDSPTFYVNMANFPQIRLDSSERKALIQLSKAQELLNKPIPFPLVRIPEEIDDLMSKPLNTTRDAEELMSQLTLKFKDRQVFITPIVTEIWLGDKIIERRSNHYLHGYHSIKLQAGANSEAQSVVEKTMSDPVLGLKLMGNCRQSARAITREIDRAIGDSEEELRNYILRLLNEKRSDSIENQQTKLEIDWHPSEDRMWYKTTAFRVALSPYMPWERWGMESDYLQEKGEEERSYFAAKEAYKANPGDPTSAIRYGWKCFKLDRLDKALEIMKPFTSHSNNHYRYLALINCGLIELIKSRQTEDQAHKHLFEAISHYENALNLASSSQSAMAIREQLQMAIDDLNAQENQTGHLGKTITQVLVRVSKSELSVEVAQAELRKLLEE